MNTYLCISGIRNGQFPDAQHDKNMNVTEITEHDVIEWLQEQRKARGLKTLQITAGFTGIKGEYHDFAAHTDGLCAIAHSLSESCAALDKKIKQKKTQMEAANA